VNRNTKIALAVGGGLLAVAAGALIYDVVTSDEDRPPIRVKGGSVSFITAKQWSGQDLLRREWKPNHPRGKPAREFLVSFQRADGVICVEASGDEVLIDVGPDAGPVLQFRVHPRKLHGLGKPEPKVAAPSEAGDPTNALDTLTFDVPGYIKRAEVLRGGNSTGVCTFTSTSAAEVVINPQ
jgi:hypothetical protein